MIALIINGGMKMLGIISIITLVLIVLIAIIIIMIVIASDINTSAEEKRLEDEEQMEYLREYKNKRNK